MRWRRSGSIVSCEPSANGWSGSSSDSLSCSMIGTLRGRWADGDSAFAFLVDRLAMVVLLSTASHQIHSALVCGRCFDVGEASKVSETGETRQVAPKASRGTPYLQ